MIEKPVYEEIREWQQLRTTKYLLQSIDASIEETKTLWASGQFTGATVDQTVQLNSNSIGFIRAMEELYNIIEDLAGDTDDNS